MPTYKTINIISDIIHQIEGFSKRYTNETFYTFAIDSGLLCLNSEEEFQKTIDQYRTSWDEENSSVTTRDSLTEDEIEYFEEVFKFQKRSGRNRFQTFDDFINDEVKMQNEAKEDSMNKGNPFFKNDKIQSIRFSTGDWAYQGFGKIQFESLKDPTYSQIQKISIENFPEELSIDNNLAPILVDILKANQNEVFKSIKITNDFKIFLANHTY